MDNRSPMANDAKQKYDESVYCVSNYPASTSSYPSSVGSVSYSVGSGSAVAISTPPPSSFAPVGYHLKPLTAHSMVSSYDLNNNNSVQQLRLPVLNGPQLQFDYERKQRTSNNAFQSQRQQNIALQRERQRQINLTNGMAGQYRMNHAHSEAPNHYQGTRNQGNNSSQSRRFHPLNPNGSTSHL
eukprot:856933_1